MALEWSRVYPLGGLNLVLLIEKSAFSGTMPNVFDYMDISDP